ncbi:hypothetical protein JCGZ_18454 [Jatropha curcas]|uniref:Uncharacterized protein n=1 Tax=Jatropha curcas TaxID=180498 RepID=A0A067KDF0_JATCU|nr:hypothetical protein JCGZ_18454 [Jatropha curcas]
MRMFKYYMISPVMSILRTDTGVGDARGRRENVRIVDVSSDIDEGELLDGSKMAKVAEVMKRKVVAESSEKEVPLVVPDTQSTEAGIVAGATHSELPPLSSTSEPPRKR